MIGLLCAIAALTGCTHEEPAPSAGATAKAAATIAATTAPAEAGSALPASAKVEALAEDRPLRIGVTLHPYFSWTKNVVGDAPGVEVSAILPGDVDAGDYQPAPKDIQKLSDLQAIVVNGIGHDDFIGSMISASGNTKLVIIGANEGTPTVKSAHGDAPNSHTFISFTNAIQETATIEKTLAALAPISPRPSRRTRPPTKRSSAGSAPTPPSGSPARRSSASSRCTTATLISARTSASRSRASSSRRTGSCRRRASSPR